MVSILMMMINMWSYFGANMTVNSEVGANVAGNSAGI